MSDLSVRERIASAASNVPVIECEPYYRQSTKTGDACVRFAGQKPDPSGLGWVATWEVWVAIPQPRAEAEKWIENNLDWLLEELAGVMTVTDAIPADLQFDPGGPTVNGLIVRGAREA